MQSPCWGHNYPDETILQTIYDGTWNSVLDHDCHIVDMVYYGNTMARSFTADCRTRKDVNESGNLQLP